MTAVGSKKAAMQLYQDRANIINNWLNTIYYSIPRRESDNGSYYDIAPSITIREFLNITHTEESDESAAWFEGNTMDTAFALLIEKAQRHKDIAIIPSQVAIALAFCGAGLRPVEDVVETYELMAKAITDEEIRWLIVPCSDGMDSGIAATRAFAQAQTARRQASVDDNLEVTEPEISSDSLGTKDRVTDGPSTNTRPEQEDQDAHVSPSPTRKWIGGSGRHWGFMILDKQTNKARWFDGHLDVRRKNGHDYIEHMFPAGGAAGKVLRGIEHILGHGDRQFSARTLMYLPDDEEDNHFGGDSGCACGPWCFEILHLLLDHPEYLTDEEGFDKVFAKAEKVRHAADLMFHSLETRNKIQGMIQTEAEISLTEDALPFQLSARVLRIIGLSFSTNALRNVASVHKFAADSATEHEANAEKKPGSGDGPGKDNVDKDDDDDEDDNDDDSGNASSENHPDNGRSKQVSYTIPDMHEYVGSGFAEARQFKQAWKTLNKASPLARPTIPTTPVRDGSSRTLEHHIVDWLNLERGLSESGGLRSFLGILRDDWYKSRSKEDFDTDHEAESNDSDSAGNGDGSRKKKRKKLIVDAGDYIIRACMMKIYGGFERYQLTAEEIHHWQQKDAMFQKRRKRAGTDEHESPKEFWRLIKRRANRFLLPTEWDVSDRSKYHDKYLQNTGPFDGWPKWLGRHEPNFAKLDAQELLKWTDEYPEILKNQDAGHNDDTTRARLHMKFYKSFDGVDKDDVENHYGNDGVITEKWPESKSWTIEKVRQQLQDYYEHWAQDHDIWKTNLEDEETDNKKQDVEPAANVNAATSAANGSTAGSNQPAQTLPRSLKRPASSSAPQKKPAKKPKLEHGKQQSSTTTSSAQNKMPGNGVPKPKPKPTPKPKQDPKQTDTKPPAKRKRKLPANDNDGNESDTAPALKRPKKNATDKVPPSSKKPTRTKPAASRPQGATASSARPESEENNNQIDNGSAQSASSVRRSPRKKLKKDEDEKDSK